VSGKGKAPTRYEFGVKVSITLNNARADGGQFVVGNSTLASYADALSF